MSVYHGHQVQRVVEGDTEGIVCTKIEWHPTYTLLAMASHSDTGSNGYVSICHDQGEVMDDLIQQRTVPVQEIEWHPEKKLLAAGWQDGGITICDVGSSKIHQQLKSHVSPITTVTWSTKGGHLMTSDRTGLFLVWRLEASGQLCPTPRHHNQLAGEPTHCVLIGRQSSSRIPQSQFMSDDSISCFIPIKSGLIYYLTAKGQTVESEKMKTAFKFLQYSEENSLLVGITEELLLIVFNVDGRGVPTRITEAKLSAQGTILGAIWCPEGTLATCSQELSIRFWDCVNEENSVLNLKENFSCTENTAVTDISYNTNSGGILAACTTSGQVALWSHNTSNSATDKDGWDHVTTFNAEGNVHSIKWSGSSKNLLAINLSSSVKILSRHPAIACYSNGLSAVQVSPFDVLIKMYSTDASMLFETETLVKGFSITKEHLVIWSDSTVAVYSIAFDKHSSMQVASFASVNCFAAIYELSVFTVEDQKLVTRNTQGVVKHRLPIGGDFEECTLSSLHVANRSLVLVLKEGAIRIWDLSRREPKLSFEKNVSQLVSGFKEVVQATSNCSGTRISLIVTKHNLSSVLVMVCPPNDDCVKVLDFSRICDEQSQGEGCSYMTIPGNLSSSVHEEQMSMADQLKNADILRCHWDSSDSKLLTMELERDIRLKRTNSRRNSKQGPERLMLSVFVTDNMEILLYNTTPVEQKYTRSLGCDVPFMYFLKEKLICPSSQGLNSSTGSEAMEHPVDKQPLKDFIGLEECEPQAIRAITSFSYYSMMGNMDEAFKAIKTVKSQKVWESLAKMCIKTRRLDVALVCLGNMGNARAAKAVRETKDIAEHDARLAVLATQLGMLDEAEELYKNSGRFDLLNLFYQASGKWQKAVEVAEVNDRLNLKLTYFNFGKHSEAFGEMQPALKSYERAEVPMEIMRMLNEDINELEEYILASKDNDVRHYWAEYLESIDDLEGAMLEYESCGDIHSQTRLLLLLGDTRRAIEVVEETRNEAAAYYLARHLSRSDKLSDIQTGIQFFTLARCYNPAIQLAKENGLDMELMNLALMSTREDKLEVAKYYESRPETQDKAIMLYHKAGELSQALDLCFQYRHYEVLHVIAEELSEGCNPVTLRKVAEYFVEQKQFDKAVDLYIRSNKASEALELCATHHIIINEDLAERMTPGKADNESPEDTQQRIQFLLELGDCLVDQEQWHLAAKKFTQAGNRIKAMKALLKSGDTEKIIYFANVSRQKEIYVMSANYLQTLNWRGNAQLMKNIISYYTKARALDALANFYDTCAQVEIDDYQNYDKAYGALNEAVRCLKKASTKSKGEIEEKVRLIQHKAQLIKKFADVRNSYATNPDEAAQQCHELLNDPQIDSALRTCDIYALLVTYYAHKQLYREAYDMLEEMRNRNPGVNIEFFLDPNVIEAVYTAQGLEPPVQVLNEDDDERERDAEGSDEIVEEFEPEP